MYLSRRQSGTQSSTREKAAYKDVQRALGRAKPPLSAAFSLLLSRSRAACFDGPRRRQRSSRCYARLRRPAGGSVLTWPHQLGGPMRSARGGGGVRCTNHLLNGVNVGEKECAQKERKLRAIQNYWLALLLQRKRPNFTTRVADVGGAEGVTLAHVCVQFLPRGQTRARIHSRK